MHKKSYFARFEHETSEERKHRIEVYKEHFIDFERFVEGKPQLLRKIRIAKKDLHEGR